MNSKKPSFPQTTTIPLLSQPLMESHSSCRLLLLCLGLAISIGGARSRLGPDVSLTPEPSASRLVPDVSPTPEPSASLLVPDVSPTPEPSASRLVPNVSLAPEPAASRLVPDVSPIPEPAATPSPFPSEDIPFEAIGLFVLSDAPAESFVVNEAAAWVANDPSPAESSPVHEAAMLVAGLNVPSANEQTPAESVAVNEAAMMVAALTTPTAKELVDDVDADAVLDSLDENNTLKTLPITSS